MLGLASQGPPARHDSVARLPPGEALPHSGVDQPPALSPHPSVPFPSSLQTSPAAAWGLTRCQGA